VLGDLHLLLGSPAIDYAMPDYSMAADYDRRSRPQGAAADGAPSSAFAA
jgi:hypothetical protein